MASRTFGEIIREARLERHLSMGQLAAAVDRSTASVRRWERDDGLPTPEVIDTLTVRLGLDPEEVAAAVTTARGDEAPTVGEAVAHEPVDADPIDVVPLVDVVEAVDAGSPGDWQQPAMAASTAAPAATPAPPGAAATATAPPPVVWPTASAPVAVVEQDQNILQILRDPHKPWLGYIRAALTIVVLGGLAYVLLWAVPEFLDAFGEMWDSLWPESETTQL